MNARKWKLSSYWWANFWFILAVCVAAEVGLLWIMCNWELSKEDLLWVPAFGMPSVALACLCCALTPWRFLMTMQVGDGVIRSHLFGRLKCEVFTDRPVYYALLEFDEHYSIVKPYIAISNHPFHIKPRDTSPFPLRSTRFIDYYDRNAVILFPRNEQARRVFPLEQWHRVGELSQKEW